MQIKKEPYLTADEITELWRTGKKPDWRQQPLQGRKEWLNACVQWTGLPKTRIHRDNYILDGLQVTDETAFYCLLGAAFFGYRGYFGQDLYGFNDCFSEIALHQKEKTLVESGSIVIIYHPIELANILNNEYGNYFKTFLGDLKKYGLDVILK